MPFSVEGRFDNVVRTRDDMHPYQNEGLEFLKANPFSHLFIDLGMGKTVTSLTLIVDLLLEFADDNPVLVVGPLKVISDTFPTEFGLWEHLAPFDYQIIREDDDDPRLKEARDKAIAFAKRVAKNMGLDAQETQKFAQSKAQKAETKMRVTLREEAARSRKSVHLINREQLEWLVNFWGAKWPYRTVIIDEVSSFKAHNSSRFKALAKACNTPGLITRLHGLTATPAAESYEHLWAQVYLLDRGKRLGKCITHYRKKYFNENRYTRKWEIREGAEEEILAKIADICLVMKAADYLKMDLPTISPRYVVLSAKQQALYKTMQEDLVVEVDDGSEVEAETAAALSNKLLQMASGVLYDTDTIEDEETGDFSKVKKVHRLHEHKIDMLKQIVEELDGEPVLVAYHFKSSLDRLLAAFPKATAMDREGKCIKAWNKGKIPILFIHPQSGGHGLNLQHGGHNIVFFDIPWSLELYLQLIGRLARQGQTKPVLVQLLLAVGTLDEKVFAALCRKESAQDDLFKLLKSLIRKLRKRKAIDACEEL